MVELLLHSGRKQKSLLVPENWDELSGSQFVAVTGVLYSLANDAYELKVQLVKALCNMKWWQMKRIGMQNISEKMLPLADFLLAPCDITNQPMPSIKTKDGLFYGPKASLENFRMNEFEKAEYHLGEWESAVKALPQGDGFKTNAAVLEQLYLFVACLYRPAKKKYDHKRDPDGDLREVFNYNLSIYFAPRLQKYVSVDTALAILLFYKGCRALLPKYFPELFGNAGQDIEEEQPQRTDYFALIRGLAKENVYGDFEAVQMMYVWTLFYAVQQSHEEYERQKQEIENMKNH